MADVPLQPTHLWYAEQVGHDGVFRLPLARLAFDYGGDVVRHDARAPRSWSARTATSSS